MTTELPPQILTQLEQLKDIRLPEPVSWWPLAPGWWGVAVLFLAAVAALMVWSILRRRTVRYVALGELEKMRGEDAANLSELATDVSALLRRVAIRMNGRSIGILSDKDWAEYLTSGRSGMPRDLAVVLSQAPYAPPKPATDEQKKKLVDAAEQWIRRCA
ncbi:MAG: DUF4381 domain-containing protein [Pseudomonadota bacterium]